MYFSAIKAQEMKGFLASAQLEINFLRTQLTFLNPIPLEKIYSPPNNQTQQRPAINKDAEEWCAMLDENHALDEVKLLNRKIESMMDIFQQ